MGGSPPAVFTGSEGMRPRGIDIHKDANAETLYFTGTDPATGERGVFRVLSSGGAVSALAKGAPFKDPSGIAVSSKKIAYVCDATGTDSEIATIAEWVDAGAPEGNPADLPPAPKFADGWQIGTPDLVLTMKEPVVVQASGTIPYETYPTDYVFPEDRWVQAIEIRPGNRRVVHHAVAEAEIPGQPGAQNVHLYSPGLDAMMWREGYGKFFPKGTRFSFQMHYNAIGKETTDLTKVGFKFATTPVHTQVNTTIVLNNTFAIPPMVQNHEIVGAFQFPTEARIHGLRPHMHLRARLGTASLITPDGNRRVLLHVPQWDDAWQNYYVLAKPARVAKGSILEYLADYDNSPANALNPDPKATVPWGQQVWDEMHSVYMTWTAVNDMNRNDGEPIQIPAKRLFAAQAGAR